MGKTLNEGTFLERGSKENTVYVNYYSRVSRPQGEFPTIIVSSSDFTTPLKNSEKFKVYTVKKNNANKKWLELKGRRRTEDLTLQEEDLLNGLEILMGGGSDKMKVLQEYLDDLKEYVKTFEISSAERLYNFLVTKTAMTSYEVNNILERDFEDNEIEGSADTIHHGFRVFFPDNMQKKRKDEFIEVLDQVHNVLSKNNASFLAQNCEVRFKPLNKKAIGLYYFKIDDLIVDPTAKKLAGNDIKGIVKVLIHELGHRLDYKFATPKFGEEIQDKYVDLLKSGEVEKSKTDELLTFKDAGLSIGQELVYNGRKKDLLQWSPWYIKDSNENGTKLFVHSTIMDKIRFDVSVNNLCNMPGWLVNGSKISCDIFSKKLQDTSNWFPSNYSKTNRAEWFAELFMYYAYGLLKGEPNEWMEFVVKRSG